MLWHKNTNHHYRYMQTKHPRAHKLSHFEEFHSVDAANERWEYDQWPTFFRDGRLNSSAICRCLCWWFYLLKSSIKWGGQNMLRYWTYMTSNPRILVILLHRTSEMLIEFQESKPRTEHNKKFVNWFFLLLRPCQKHQDEFIHSLTNWYHSFLLVRYLTVCIMCKY